MKASFQELKTVVGGSAQLSTQTTFAKDYTTRRIDIAGKINQGGRTQLNWDLRAELAGIRWSEMLVKSHLKKGDNKQRYCGEKKGFCSRDVS